MSYIGGYGYEIEVSLTRSTANANMAAETARQLKDYDSISRGSVEVCRIMSPDDANLAGNVHGGTTLKLLEEAGCIIATRHCNSNNTKTGQSAMFAALARVERTDFLQPMYIGEVAQVHAELSFASSHSLEVKAYVWAENLVTGSRRLTNRASLWYVPIATDKDGGEVGEVPPLQYASAEEEEQGRRRYKRQKKSRVEKEEILKSVACNCSGTIPSSHPDETEVPRYSVTNSRSSLIHSVQPSDCGQFNVVYGGVIMKIMDSLAGMVAFRHCKTNIVTASIDAIDFHAPVNRGHIIYFIGQMTFTSAKSMEIEVIADAQDLLKGKCFRACSAFFTFVSLDENRRPQAVPKLELHTDEERQRFEAGRARYGERKQRRQSQEDN